MADTLKPKTRDIKGDDLSNRPNREGLDRSDDDTRIIEEVKRLIKEGLKYDSLSYDYLIKRKLREKYKNQQLVDAIMDAYKKRLDYIIRKAKKFKQLIINKYAVQHLPFNKLMLKAKKYQKKYKLTDDEFNMFINLSISDKALTREMLSMPYTQMAKMLGYESITNISEKLNVKETELFIVQEILKLYGETKSLHAQVLLQSITYRDVAPEAIVGKYDPGKHNAFSYVHPVIAALFLPKIPLLDEHMLIANLGYILSRKFDGLPIMTKPDFEVYWDLITDPNENVCSMISPIEDYKNRFLLQTKLWESVLNLRQGKYYQEKLNDFFIAIDNCRNNIYDAPDLTYIKDEGSILRKLLSAFSLRPTIVSTFKLYNILGSLHNIPTIDPLYSSGVTQFTTVPIIILRLPVSVSGQTTAISLDDALNQPQWYVENNMIVPKAQTIIHNRDVLFFYVGRRYQSVNIARLVYPCNFVSLPMTVAGWESLNDRIVNFEMRMNIVNDTYQLRSVVIIENSPTRKNLIVGSSAAIVIPMDISLGRYEDTFLLYDPQGASEMFKVDGTYERNDPITYIPGHTPFNGENTPESFYKRASTRGTIFVYQKISSSPCPPF